ncbi:MAG: response regulator [Chitinophagales bacterium]
MRSPIRVLLADDHKLVRAGIRSLLESLKGIEVVAEADDAAQTLELAGNKEVDIILMDIAMHGMNGLEAAARVIKEHPGLKIIILSMYVNEEYVWQALRTGASGYLLKDAVPVELELAIKSVADGLTYLSPAVSDHVVTEYVKRVNGEVGFLDRITPRQREIWRLIAEGSTTKEIAAELDISVKTVETHRAQLMERLDTRDVAGLVRLAIKTGLITSR